ncbi:MAG: hypothetical protein DWP98_14160 [Bacteroidetes bacterium]|nr:MAG: hypothetical protein DWP98_14160 [Bacteroidota bacterium]MBL1145362.1 hypothetical protein [Bacteroidota bacterium]
MKHLLLLFVLINLTVYSQDIDKNLCKAIVINDSLFNTESDSYEFDIVTNNIVHNIVRYQIENINDIITVEDNCLFFRISYACGCGDNKSKLVSDGQLFRDNQGNLYYQIKLIFKNENQFCKALCHDRLLFDISSLKDNLKVNHLKFEGFDNLIKL